ncbi:MAG TPA: LysR family transcriptional regulator [Candidatus Binatia bacterium]|jgi:DNA-binding transcriptional LysR family regulator
MTFWQLKVFTIVAKETSFTQAGKVLRITQPSVSAAIGDLQKDLGAQLFVKLGMKPYLTEAGRRLLPLAERALASIDRIPQAMDEVRGLKKSLLKVGGSPLAAATFLPAAVHAFKERHPEIDVILKIQKSESLGNKLLAGELDVAVLGRPVPSRLLIGKPYREEAIVAIAPPGHPLAKKRSVSLNLIAKEPLVVPAEGGPVRQMIEKRFAEKRLPFEPVIEVDVQYGGRDALRSAVASGLGIGFASMCYAAWEIRAGRLKLLKVPALNLKRKMYIVFHKSREQTPTVQLFVKHLSRYRN